MNINQDAIHDIVCWRDMDGGVHVNVPQDIVYHSPTGLEFGYEGLGPADLALNILAPIVGEPDARRLHQQFKTDFVAKLPRQGGTITAQQIGDWLTRANNADAAASMPYTIAAAATPVAITQPAAQAAPPPVQGPAGPALHM